MRVFLTVLAILAATMMAPALAQAADVSADENVITAPASDSAATEAQIASHAPTPLFRPEGHVSLSSWPEHTAIPVQQAILVEPRK